MKKLLLFIFLLSSAFTYAQKDSVLFLHYYQADKGLMFKWLPESYQTFQDGFKKGYNIYRAEVLVTNGVEKAGNFAKLNAEPIVHWSIDKLETEFKKDSSLVAAGIFIKGADEILNRPPSHNMAEAFKESQAQGMVNLLGAFSAISSNKSAEALGMYFLDNQIAPDKKYLYKIELVAKPEIHSFLLIFPLKNSKKEKVMGVRALLTPGAVYLSWFNNNNKTFPYYNVYRSEKKNGPFVKLNVLPLVGTVGNADFDKSSSYYIDSLKEYNKTYYYKVNGINAFEVEGVASELVEVKTFYLLKNPPRISESINPQGQDIQISWAIDAKDKPFIKGYSVFRAGSATGQYYKVNKELIKTNTQTFLDQTAKGSSNYYVVSAYGASDDSVSSIFHAHLLIDSIPPDRPVIVEGVCDTNGVVTLKWKQNSEKDMLGYRIFKTDILEGEPLRIVPGHIADTLIVDTVDLKRPYNKVYYRIAALDQHFNASVPSAYFEVKLPDINPPSNGYFKEYSVGMSGITLTWENSSAYDLKTMHLLRKSDEEFEFKAILSLTGDSLKVTAYTDTTTLSFANYQYMLVAEDEAGLKSEPSKILLLKQLDKRKFAAVTGLRAIASRDNKMVKLSWDFPENAKGFKIYRSRNGGPLETYEFVKGDKREFYDKWLKPKSKYTYIMVAELPGGFESGYSNKIEVNY